jgi:hypothetical protein
VVAEAPGLAGLTDLADLDRLTLIELTWRDASGAARALARTAASGGVPLHTCARASWLCDRDAAVVLAELWAHTPTVRTGVDAVRHFFRVAVGQDSLVEGEADVGVQLRVALEATAGGASRPMRILRHELVRLLREGRLAGFVRPHVGLAEVAVAEILRGGGSAVGPGSRVGVVGAGTLGRRVVHALGRHDLAPVLFNRTPASDALALDRIADEPVAAWIVATSAPAPWFVPPVPVPLVDLGHVRQSLAPQAVSLDLLLARPGLRLSDDRRAASIVAIEAAVSRVVRRLDSRSTEARA